MGEYGKAVKCYQRQLNKLENNNSYAAGCCYTGIGGAATMSGDYNSAVQYHEKALNINQTIRNNNGNIAGSYSNLANALKYRKDYKTALKYYRECLKIQKKIYGSDSLEVAKTYVNMGHLYGEQLMHGDALKYHHHSDALSIQEKK
jgi:tetratricopeptide (TPR) repeat protein